MKHSFAIFFILFFLCIANISKAEISAGSILDNLSCPGWSSAAATNSLDAKNQRVLEEFGVISVMTKSFQLGPRSVYVTLCQFGTNDGAYGAYTCLRKGSSNFVKRGDASSEDEDSISLWQGPYYANIRSSIADDPDCKGVVSHLADLLASKLNEHGHIPLLIRRLPTLERLAGSEKFFMGSEGARMSAAVPFLSSLKIGQSVGAAYAEYQFAQPQNDRLRLLVVSYPTAELAKTIYGEYCDALIAANKQASETGSGLFCKVSDSYLFTQWRGLDLIVIAGAKRKSSPFVLLRQI